MLRHTKKMILAGLVLLGNTAAAADTTKRSTMTYEAFVDATANHHPERALDGKVRDKVREDQRRSGLLPDPQFTVGRNLVPLPQRYQHVAASDMERAKAETTYGLSQSFPWPGTLAAEERAAKARADAVETDISLAAQGRRFAASELYLRLVRTAKLIDAERANLVVVNGIREFAHEKFKQGVGSHMEFIQSHTEAGVLQANVASLELDLKNLKRHALLLMDHQADIAPDAIDFVLEWPRNLIAAKADQDANQDLARERILRSKDADLSRQDAEYRRSLPLFNVSGMLMQEDSGMRMYAAIIGVSLPIYSNIQRSSYTSEGLIAESQAEGELAWHERRKALALLQTEGRIAQIEANLSVLTKDIIPPVREHIEAATSQFSQGKGDIAAIVDGRRTLLNLQMTEVRTTESLALARLSIEKIAAGFIDESIDQEVPQLVGTSTSGMGNSASMPGTTTGKPSVRMKNAATGPRPARGRLEKPEDETAKGATKPGMGM